MKQGCTATLRIRRVFLERILAGEKRVEYRDARPYYQRLLERRPITALRLHYQSPRRVLAEVKRIERIPKPAHLGDAFGEYVYAIHLGRAVEE